MAGDPAAGGGLPRGCDEQEGGKKPGRDDKTALHAWTGLCKNILGRDRSE
jgi:hypothetical protein